MWLNRFKELPLALRVLFLASFVNRAGMFVFPLLAVYLVRGEGLNPGEAGLLISIGSTGLLAGSLLSGPLCDLRGRRTALLTALLLNAAGYLGLAVFDGPPWTYAGLLFIALIGMGMFSPASNTLVADLTTPEQRTFAYTISYVGNNLGMGVGPLLGGVAAAYSYHLMFAGNILAGLACAAMIVIWVPRDRRVGVGKRKDKIRSGSLGHGHVLLIVLVSFSTSSRSSASSTRCRWPSRRCSTSRRAWSGPSTPSTASSWSASGCSWRSTSGRTAPRCCCCSPACCGRWAWP